MRSALLVPFAVAPWPAAAQLFGAPAGPPAATRFGRVAVDISPLIDHGGGGAARALGPALLAQMRKVFGDRIGGGGPVLTARITNLFLASYTGNEGSLGFGGNDNIEGDGIVSSGGRVLSTTRILTELRPAYSGSYNTPDVEGLDDRRVSSIAYQFAYWLRREMNL